MHFSRRSAAFLTTLLAAALATGACGNGAGGAATTIPATAPAVTDDTQRTIETTTTRPENATTSTSVPKTTTTALPEPGPTGSLESPLPVGEVVQVGDWRIRVAGVNPDGTDLVLAENQFNDPPVEGRQFFLVGLEATYVGTESSDYWFDLSAKVVGPSNVAYESFEDHCGVIPDAIDDSGETFPGGSIAGNACWSVATDDADGLVLLIEDAFTFEDTRVYLSLDPSVTPVEASTTDGADGSSRVDQAIPVGQSAEVGPWTLTVVEVVGDATDAVLAENQFNEPPEGDDLFYMATVEATYDGPESSTFWVDMALKAVGDLSVAYEGFDGSCGVIPDAIDDSGETFPGGTIMGNVCWRVSADDVGSLVMIAEESFTLDNERLFFSLTPDAS